MSVQMELHKIIISEMQDQQIIVLTCRLRSFAPLGDHTLRVEIDGDCR